MSLSWLSSSSSSTSLPGSPKNDESIKIRASMDHLEAGRLWRRHFWSQRSSFLWNPETFLYFYIFKFLHFYIFTFLHFYTFTFLHFYIFTFLPFYTFTFLHSYIFKFYIWAGWAFFESVKQFDILSPWGWSPLVHHIQVFYLVLPRLPHLHMSYLEPSHPLAVIAMTLFLQIFVAQKVWWWCWWWW